MACMGQRDCSLEVVLQSNEVLRIPGNVSLEQSKKLDEVFKHASGVKVCVCVCVCERERKREKAGERDAKYNLL